MMKTVTKGLKEARVDAGLGREKCARLAGVNEPLLYRYEAGLRRPGMENATKIAGVLGVGFGEVEEFRHLGDKDGKAG